MMEFNQIRYFLALAETLNFTRAAENCCVSQPALTRAIRLLEEELGGQLLIRHGRDTRLSELGRELHSSFMAIEIAKRDLKETASAAIAGECGDLNIGIVDTVLSEKLARLLCDFRRQQPGTNITIHSVPPMEAGDMLLSGALDACFTADIPVRHAKIEYNHLYSDQMAAIFPKGHRFGGVKRLTIEEFADETIIARRHCVFHDHLSRTLRQKDIKVMTSISADNDEWSARLVQSGAGVAIIPVETAIHLGMDHKIIDEADAIRSVELAAVYGGPKSVALRAIIKAALNFEWAAAATTTAKPARREAKVTDCKVPPTRLVAVA